MMLAFNCCPGRRTRWRFQAGVVLVGLLGVRLAGGELAVDASNQAAASPSGSASNPYPTVQAAIDAAASGDIIRVAQGTYAGNVVIADKSITLMGGYQGGDAAAYAAGTPGDFTSRDPTTHLSLLQGSAASAVVTLRLTGASGSVIDGFQVRGGRQGVLFDSDLTWPLLSNVTVRGCVIEGNGLADPEQRGGGLSLSGTDHLVEANTVRGNLSGRGAGIGLNGEGNHLTLRSNLVSGNIGYGDHGGGLYLAGTVAVTDNVIEDNRIGEDLGYGWGGGLIVFGEGTVATLARNVIRGNHTPGAGGGVYVDDGAQAFLSHNLIVGNSADEFAGGLYVEGAESVEPPLRSFVQVDQCTVAGNTSSGGSGGVGLTVNYSEVEVRDSIWWDNGTGPDFFLLVPGGTLPSDTALRVDYCLTQQAWAGSGSDNRTGDPLFANASGGDFHLRSTGGRWDPAGNQGAGGWLVDATHSPAIDAGDPAADFALEQAPNGGRVNLGAYGNTAQASRSGLPVGENDPPTDLQLTGDAVRENQPAGVFIGRFLAVDPNPGDTHRFTLVSGPGDAGNNYVAIAGDALRTSVRLDTRRFATLPIRVRADDHRGGTLEREFVVQVLVSPNTAPVADPVPGRWLTRGVGGGGALFAPSFNPRAPDELFIQCDMSEVFHSTNAGLAWETLDFGQIQGGNLTSPIQFTSDPSVLYGLSHAPRNGLDAVSPVKSLDGGRTWQLLAGDPTGGEAWSLQADPGRTDRLLVSSYDRLFFSGDGGDSFQDVFQANDLYVAGTFWSGNTILVGTRAGLVVSSNGGAQFDMAALGGLPAEEAMVSMCGAESGGVTRLFCVTLAAGDVYPGITGAEHWGFRGVHRLDYAPGQAWTRVVAADGLDGDRAFFVSMARNDLDVAYLAGAEDSPVVPVVYKTTDGGQSWRQVLFTADNQNVATGWQGTQGDRAWWYGEYALGFQVCPSDANRVILTDLGFPHLSTDGGLTWRQAYVHPIDQHPAGGATPRGAAYHSAGIENTSCWWLTWTDPGHLYADFSDIRGIRSEDRGITWSLADLELNSSYHSVVEPGTRRLFIAVASAHDMYQSTHLDDASIDSATGGVLFSDDHGVSWRTLHDFGHVVVRLALGAVGTDTLYAAVVHHGEGDVYVTDERSLGAGAAWRRLASPPRTEGHPFNVHVLDDGVLLCTYSGRRDATGQFTPSSGVFLSGDGGVSWEDRGDPAMRFWTQDVIVDPHDATQQTWYGCVFSGWGGAPNGLGGLYRTKNRGVSWTRLCDLNRVRSCTVSPDDADLLFLTTEEDGLWVTRDLRAAAPAFSPAASYPFKNPTRVLFNPYDSNELWIASFGRGLVVGRVQEPGPRFERPRRAAGGMFEVDVIAEAGQRVTVEAGAALGGWLPLRQEDVLDGGFTIIDEGAPSRPGWFFRARAE